MPVTPRESVRLQGAQDPPDPKQPPIEPPGPGRPPIEPPDPPPPPMRPPGPEPPPAEPPGPEPPPMEPPGPERPPVKASASPASPWQKVTVGSRAALCLLALAVAGCARRSTLEHPIGATHADTPPPEPTPVVKSESAPVEPAPKRCGLPDRYFDAPHFTTNDSMLLPRGKDLLAELAKCLYRNQQRIVVLGRADPRGSARHNAELGLERARSVRRFLVRLGVEPERITVKSCGEQGATGDAPESWRRERFVAIRSPQDVDGACVEDPWQAARRRAIRKSIVAGGADD